MCTNTHRHGNFIATVLSITPVRNVKSNLTNVRGQGIRQCVRTAPSAYGTLGTMGMRIITAAAIRKRPIMRRRTRVARASACPPSFVCRTMQKRVSKFNNPWDRREERTV